MSNATRAICAGGTSPSAQNVIDYVTIASTGNSQDFGDLTSAKQAMGTGGDGHGGLS